MNPGSIEITVMKNAIEFHKIDKVHQILISDEYSSGDSLPHFIENNARSLISLYPEAEYKLWTLDELRTFIDDNLGREVCFAFDKLKAYAYKADLARYCLLYILGGVYSDLGIKMMGKWNVPKTFGISAFRELNFTSRSWTILQNGLLWALPRRKELSTAIECIVQNCEHAYYGAGPLYPTGPVLLGRAFAAQIASFGQSDVDDQWVGEYRWVTPDGAMKNDAYIAPDFSLIGFRTKLIPGDLLHLGLTGTNNYHFLWSRRKIYGERHKFWSHSDESIKVFGVKRADNGVTIPREHVGIVNSGPYINLAAGEYVLELFFDSNSFGRLQAEVFSLSGIQMTYDVVVGQNGSGGEVARIEFALRDVAPSVEFRILSSGEFSGVFTGFSLELSRCFDRVWRWNDDKIVLMGGLRSEDGIEISPSETGPVLRVPCNDIEPGTYAIKVEFSESVCPISKLKVDFVSADGKRTMRHLVYEGDETRTSSIVLEFTTNHVLSDAEMVIIIPNTASARIQELSLSCRELL